MPTTEPYSSPFILDLDMSDNVEDPDFEFFDPNTPYISPASPSTFLSQHPASEDKSNRFAAVGTPRSPHHLNPAHVNLFDSSPNAPSMRSSNSPADSYPDSSSDSSAYKRKSSSESSRSAFTTNDISMNDADARDWKGKQNVTSGDNMEGYAQFQPSMNSTSPAPAYAFSDKAMENDFDFESAASSPNNNMPTMKSPDMPTIRHNTSKRMPAAVRTRNGHQSKASVGAASESPSTGLIYRQQNSITQSMHGLTTNNASREASPLSNVMTSHGSSPSTFFNNSLSSGNGLEFINGTMLNSGPQSNPWPPTTYDFSMPDQRMDAFMQPPQNIRVAMPFTGDVSNMASMYKPKLTVHPTPLKSRVETQIPIKMTLFPVPPGVTKLHLPTHTISKPKLLAKPSPAKAPDTLELTTTLVCTSAMQNPEFRRRAFARAAGTLLPPEPKEEEDGEVALDDHDENKPLNGGEVKICSGCITRERKRAARKKVKKVEEEESWYKDEDKRVIVFNTQEIKDWQQPSSQPQSDSVGDRREPHVPEGAMQVDAPMRIACYCRHQNEKLGFKVIFTIKDWSGQLIAQEITSSIMITDDHKTHNMPQMPGGMGHGMDAQAYLHNQTLFNPEMVYNMPMVPFRASHSSADLQNMQQQNFPLQFAPPNLNVNQPQASMPASMTPRSLSRQASPSESYRPSTKKRKASGGSTKVPSGLAMTRMDPVAPSSFAPGATRAAQVMPPFNAPAANFSSPQDVNFSHAQPVGGATPQFNGGPSTPNSNDQAFFSNNRTQSMDNLAMQQMFSAPASALPSRAPSPNSLRNVQAYQQHQAQIAQAVANGLYGMPLSLNPQRPPTIHKMIPNEGPKAGGIEVTCLGSGFCQGLEVMFGEVKATTTTFWGETSLVCLLPPATSAGTVPVTFKHQHQQQLQPYPSPPIPKQQAFFKYVDDDEQQIIRTALSVLGHKMTGRMEDVRDLARRIVGDGPSSWNGGSQASSGGGGGGQPPVSGFSAATFGVDVESTLLKILDLIDLDDSSRLPRFNTKRASGQTMLHLACALGLTRFVAGLLARGANPEPRDNGGFTPMHFAALHNHPQIVKRLMLSGADPSWRTLKGDTAADLCTDEETLCATRRIEHHSRRRSVGSMRSKSSSATSLRSLWEPPSAALSGLKLEPIAGEDSSSGAENEDVDDEGFFMRSRRRSSVAPATTAQPTADSASLAVPDATAGGLVSPAAAMVAFRDHVTAQIQHLQQSVQHLNLPQMPQMPNLPNYQAYLPAAPMVRRISSLVPHIGSPKTSNVDQAPKEDSKWWDLFSGSSPPAYEEIYPQADLDTKRASAERAAADAVADSKCATLFDQSTGVTAGPSSAIKQATKEADVLRLEASIDEITEEEQVQLHLASTTKVRFRSDRKLFFIWVSPLSSPFCCDYYINYFQMPILALILAAMLYNQVPQLVSSFSRWRAGHVVEVL